LCKNEGRQDNPLTESRQRLNTIAGRAWSGGFENQGEKCVYTERRFKKERIAEKSPCGTESRGQPSPGRPAASEQSEQVVHSARVATLETRQSIPCGFLPPMNIHTLSRSASRVFSCHFFCNFVLMHGSIRASDRKGREKNRQLNTLPVKLVEVQGGLYGKRNGKSSHDGRIH
jgi:hypothetical protein